MTLRAKVGLISKTLPSSAMRWTTLRMSYAARGFVGTSLCKVLDPPVTRIRRLATAVRISRLFDGMNDR